MSVQMRRHPRKFSGVSQPGTDNGQSKLDEHEVRMIRSMKMTQRKLAAIFGVSQVQISNIQRGRAWKHVG